MDLWSIFGSTNDQNIILQKKIIKNLEEFNSNETYSPLNMTKKSHEKPSYPL